MDKLEKNTIENEKKELNAGLKLAAKEKALEILKNTEINFNLFIDENKIIRNQEDLKKIIKFLAKNKVEFVLENILLQEKTLNNIENTIIQKKNEEITDTNKQNISNDLNKKIMSIGFNETLNQLKMFHKEIIFEIQKIN